MSDKQIKPAKPAPLKPTPVRPTTPKPTPVTPQKAEGHSSCVRCRIPLERTWGHAQCGLCKRELAAMHEACEYTMYRKTYYIPSTEGASLDWLLTNGYQKEVMLPKKLRVRDSTEGQTLVNTT